MGKNKFTLFVSSILLFSLAIFTFIPTFGSLLVDNFLFLPLIKKSEPPPSPTSTPFPTNTPDPNLTPLPTPLAELPDIRITHIHYDGAGSSESDEYIQIQNYESRSIQLQFWTLRDEANHVFPFPQFVMQPGQECRVYTNEFHSASCAFSYGSGSAIWNNGGDCAELRNSGDSVIDTYCYP